MKTSLDPKSSVDMKASVILSSEDLSSVRGDVLITRAFARCLLVCSQAQSESCIDEDALYWQAGPLLKMVGGRTNPLSVGDSYSRGRRHVSLTGVGTIYISNDLE